MCKEIKPVVKEAMRLHNKPCDNTNSPWQEQYEMAKRKRDFRAFHIARCELRGRTRERMRNHPTKTSPTKKPSNPTNLIGVWNLKKLYVLTRKDLPIADQAVQSGHALAEYLLKHKDAP